MPPSVLKLSTVLPHPAVITRSTPQPDVPVVQVAVADVERFIRELATQTNLRINRRGPDLTQQP